MAERLKPGGIFLLNTPYSADEVWSRLPQEVQATLNQKKARFYVVNAAKIARECSLGARINTVMQMAFFHLTQILPGDSALAELQAAIAKSYSSKGQELVERNWQALALARESLAEVPLQPVNASSPNRPPVVSRRAGFRQNGHRRDAGRARRCAAGLCPAAGRHLAHGHHPLGETQHRRRDPHLEGSAVYSVQPLRRRLPALGDPRQSGRPGKRWRTPLPACIRWM